MKWNATIVVTLFFNPHELTKMVLKKFYELLWCQTETFGLTSWTKTVFYVFPRNIQYKERLKGPPFQIFLALRLFLKKIPKGSPFNFLMFCGRMDVQWMSPPLGFLDVVRLCFGFFSNFFCTSILWCFATMDVKMRKDPFLARLGPRLRAPGAQIPSFGFFVSLILFWDFFEFFWHFHVLLLFLSFRYGADLCRSRLVSIKCRFFHALFCFVSEIAMKWNKNQRWFKAQFVCGVLA